MHFVVCMPSSSIHALAESDCHVGPAIICVAQAKGEVYDVMYRPMRKGPHHREWYVLVIVTCRPPPAGDGTSNNNWSSLLTAGQPVIWHLLDGAGLRRETLGNLRVDTPIDAIVAYNPCINNSTQFGTLNLKSK